MELEPLVQASLAENPACLNAKTVYFYMIRNGNQFPRASTVLPDRLMYDVSFFLCTTVVRHQHACILECAMRHARYRSVRRQMLSLCAYVRVCVKTAWVHSFCWWMCGPDRIARGVEHCSNYDMMTDE